MCITHRNQASLTRPAARDKAPSKIPLRPMSFPGKTKNKTHTQTRTRGGAMSLFLWERGPSSFRQSQVPRHVPSIRDNLVKVLKSHKRGFQKTSTRAETRRTTRRFWPAGAERMAQGVAGFCVVGSRADDSTCGRFPEKRVVESTQESLFFPVTGTARVLDTTN